MRFTIVSPRVDNNASLGLTCVGDFYSVCASLFFSGLLLLAYLFEGMLAGRVGKYMEGLFSVLPNKYL